jgi:hypothetical protein
MTAPKGVSSKSSGYKTHSYCTNCEKWKEGKPIRCDYCKLACRMKSKYLKSKEVKRIG